MQPEDVLVITLDGKVHQVTDRQSITISEPTGPLLEVQAADPADPEVLVTTTIRGPGPVIQHPGTRFLCGCGLTFDAKNTEPDGTGRWTQGESVDCPSC